MSSFGSLAVAGVVVRRRADGAFPQMSLQRGINLRALAEKMGQCSGAEVRGICTEAGMYALRERRQHVTQEDFEFAVAKVGVADHLFLESI